VYQEVSEPIGLCATNAAGLRRHLRRVSINTKLNRNTILIRFVCDTDLHDQRIKQLNQPPTGYRLASQLLDDKNGRFVCKGDYSCCRANVTHATVASGQCPTLKVDLADRIAKYNQQHFGIQPFIEGFKDMEFRFVLTASPDPTSPSSSC
jgi:hypothetical protein